MAITDERKLDLLNTLAMTLVYYSQENGGGVAIAKHPTTPGWCIISIRAHYCEKCKRLSPDAVECRWCRDE